MVEGKESWLNIVMADGCGRAIRHGDTTATAVARDADVMTAYDRDLRTRI